MSTDQTTPDLRTIVAALSRDQAAILRPTQWRALTELPPWAQALLRDLYAALGPVFLAWLAAKLDDILADEPRAENQ